MATASFGRSVVPHAQLRRRSAVAGRSDGRGWGDPMAVVVLLPLALAEDCASFRGRGFCCPERPPPWRGRGLIPSCPARVHRGPRL
jgi:hypothetical protein